METELNECIHVNVSPITHTHTHVHKGQTLQMGRHFVSSLHASSSSTSLPIAAMFEFQFAFHQRDIILHEASQTHSQRHKDTLNTRWHTGPPSHTLSLTHRTHTNAKLSFISFNTNLTMEQNKQKKKQYESKTKQKSQKKTINILCLDIYERKLQTKLKRILTTTTN